MLCRLYCVVRLDNFNLCNKVQFPQLPVVLLPRFNCLVYSLVFCVLHICLSLSFSLSLYVCVRMHIFPEGTVSKQTCSWHVFEEASETHLITNQIYIWTHPVYRRKAILLLRKPKPMCGTSGGEVMPILCCCSDTMGAYVL